ncbi:hypothetical protein EDP1_2961 [Pseudomonas putida S610]|nr:hypothetical protein EDP1_2961 [Pseudomonas putida S610]
MPFASSIAFIQSNGKALEDREVDELSELRVRHGYVPPYHAAVSQVVDAALPSQPSFLKPKPLPSPPHRAWYICVADD